MGQIEESVPKKSPPLILYLYLQSSSVPTDPGTASCQAAPQSPPAETRGREERGRLGPGYGPMRNRDWEFWTNERAAGEEERSGVSQDRAGLWL